MKHLVFRGEDKATKGTNVNNVTKFFTLSSGKCCKLRCIIGKEPIDFLFDTGAPVTQLRREPGVGLIANTKILYNPGKDTDWWELMAHQYQCKGSA